jgi:hypothetical protein
MEKGKKASENFKRREKTVEQHQVVDAQRTPFRSRTTGFLCMDVFYINLVLGRPLFLGMGKGGGTTLYDKSSLTLQT